MSGGTKALLAPLWRALASRLAPFLAKTPVIYGDRRKVLVAPTARLVNALLNVQSGTIVVRDYAFCGHNVSFLTGGHDLERFGAERQRTILDGRNIVVEQGAWINSGAIIIGPCTIGAHAVVLAGSVVTSDVPAYSMVGGVPARLIRMLGEASA